MSDKDELIELCKIAQHLGGPQNLSAVGIGRYLRLCSPEVVLALFDEVEALRKALKTIREESHDIGACECAADALADHAIMSISTEKSQGISRLGRDGIVAAMNEEVTP